MSREKMPLPQSSIAYSINGRDFSYEASLSTRLAVGSYVTITTENGEEYLGQIITQDIVVKDKSPHELGMDHADVKFMKAMISPSWSPRSSLRIRYIQGAGRLLGKLDTDGLSLTTGKDIFQEAVISTAPDEAVVRYFSSVTKEYATLEIGRVLNTEGQARALLKANGFDRHSFLCGQSGSGKTFALGVIIEQLLLETDLRIVIIDPNSDFVRLNKLRSIENVNGTRSVTMPVEQYEFIEKRYNEIESSFDIMRPKGQAQYASSSLRIRFSDLEPHEQEAILRLDPLADRQECHLFWTIIDNLVKQRDYSFADVYSRISDQSQTDGVEPIRQRIDNLRVADWDIWCLAEESSLADILGGDWRCIVVDIGMLSPPQNSIVAMAVLGHFWRHRDRKEPVLVVIDEAHQVCPHTPLSAFDSMSTEHAIRIAGEGRKFGIYLLLATQRPVKVHSNVVSQCDNLVLMRMNSSRDLDYIAETFSQIPRSLLDQSSNFSQGEALLGGKIVSGATFAGFEGRLSCEGGSDVPVTWAERGYQDSGTS